MPADFVIAIDGPAGSGKSSTARAVARALSLAHLDSGALYRAVTLAALRRGVPIEEGRLHALSQSGAIRLVLKNDEFVPTLGGVDVSTDVRSEAVTADVSAVAAMPLVRDWVNGELRRAARQHNRGVVVDGRDIGTVVFPDARLKVFLTAEVSERARRRAIQDGGSLESADIHALGEVIAARDDADSTRAVAPLRPAPDAVVIDTTAISFAAQVEQIAGLARRVHVD
jgi:CMP/dCMP kinase